MGKPVNPEDELLMDQEVIPVIHVFLVSGKTFTFKRVIDLVENETGLTFTYASMKDGSAKEAHFPWGHGIVGYSRRL